MGIGCICDSKTDKFSKETFQGFVFKDGHNCFVQCFNKLQNSNFKQYNLKLDQLPPESRRRTAYYQMTQPKISLDHLHGLISDEYRSSLLQILNKYNLSFLISIFEEYLNGPNNSGYHNYVRSKITKQNRQSPCIHWLKSIHYGLDVVLIGQEISSLYFATEIRNRWMWGTIDSPETTLVEAEKINISYYDHNEYIENCKISIGIQECRDFVIKPEVEYWILRGCDVLCICISIINYENAMNTIKKYLQEIVDLVNNVDYQDHMKYLSVIIVGCDVHLRNNNLNTQNIQFTLKDGMEVADKFGFPYIETSAKENVNMIFLAKQCIRSSWYRTQWYPINWNHVTTVMQYYNLNT